MSFAKTLLVLVVTARFLACVLSYDRPPPRATLSVPLKDSDPVTPEQVHLRHTKKKKKNYRPLSQLLLFPHLIRVLYLLRPIRKGFGHNWYRFIYYCIVLCCQSELSCDWGTTESGSETDLEDRAVLIHARPAGNMGGLILIWTYEFKWTEMHYKWVWNATKMLHIWDARCVFNATVFCHYFCLEQIKMHNI